MSFFFFFSFSLHKRTSEELKLNIPVTLKSSCRTLMLMGYPIHYEHFDQKHEFEIHHNSSHSLGNHIRLKAEQSEYQPQSKECKGSMSKYIFYTSYVYACM